MDFDSKLEQFKKRALWKQLEGYKKHLAMKEMELKQCEIAKVDSQRVSKSIGLALSKIISCFPENEKNEDINEALKPCKDFILDCNINENIYNDFVILLQILSKNTISNTEKIVLKSISSASDTQKDLILSELESKCTEQSDNVLLLENKIFMLEKKISMLEANKYSNEQIESNKRSRNEVDNNFEPAEIQDQEILSKFNILSVELEEYKKIMSSRSSELESMFADNQKLKKDLELKNEQIRKIPQELLKDGALAHRQLLDDLKRYKYDLNDASSTIKMLKEDSEDSKYRYQKLISQLERDVKDKYTKLDEYVKNTDHEIARLRKDRDSMRQMYEQSNQLLSSCQKQLSSYQKSSQCSEMAISQLTSTVSKLKSHLELIPNISNSNVEISKAIETLRADEQLYVEELENMGKAFEQIQIEVENLIKTVEEKEQHISKLMGDKLKAEFSLSQIQKEAESSFERSQKIEEMAKHRIAEIEIRDENLKKQLLALEKNVSEQILAIHGYKTRLNEASSENNYLRAKVDKCLSELSAVKLQEIPSSGQKDQLAFEKTRLSEELQIVKKKLDAYSSSGIGIVKDLEDELSNYKKLMKCNSCHIRDKNAVILKCMHCFCKTCLDIRLETRQRKCPNCGDPFGASDVKQIFL